LAIFARDQRRNLSSWRSRTAAAAERKLWAGVASVLSILGRAWRRGELQIAGVDGVDFEPQARILDQEDLLSLASLFDEEAEVSAGFGALITG